MPVTAKFDFSNTTTANSGFLVTNGYNTLGDLGTTNGITLELVQAWSSVSSLSTLIEPSGSPYYTDFNEACLENYWVISSGATAILKYKGFTPGSSQKFRYMSPNSSSSRPLRVTDGTTTVDVTSAGGSTPLTPSAPTEITSVADGSGHITHTFSIVSTNAILAAATVEPAVTGPTITGITGGNSTVQYALKTITGTGFGATQGTGSFVHGGVTVTPTSWSNTSISWRVPGSLSTGDHDIVIEEDGGQTATLADVPNTQTYSIAAPTFPVDSNSIWVNQGWAVGDATVYWGGPSLPTDWAFKAPYTAWSDAPTAQDVNDFLEPPEGFEGDEVFTFNRIYSDGTTVSWDVTMSVSNGVIGIVIPRNSIKFSFGF